MARGRGTRGMDDSELDPVLTFSLNITVTPHFLTAIL